MTCVFAQSGFLSVVETTYLGIVLMRSEYGSPERVGQTGAKPSYVRRPISTASQASSRSVWICIGALVVRPVEEATGAAPRSRRRG